jgi:hypothetical protein
LVGHSALTEPDHRERYIGRRRQRLIAVSVVVAIVVLVAVASAGAQAATLAVSDAVKLAEKHSGMAI